MNTNSKSALAPWLIWLAPAAFVFFLIFIQTSVGVMIQPLQKDFRLDSFKIGILASSFFYSYLLFQIPIGSFVDKFGVRKILLLSIAGTIFSCLSFAFSTSFTFAVLCRCLTGLFFASAFTCAFYVGAVNFSIGAFPLIVGLTEMVAMLGGGFSVEVISRVVKDLGWRHTVIFCSFFAVILFIYAFIFINDKKKEAKQIAKSNIIDNLSLVFKSRDAWICGLFAGILFSPTLTVGGLWGVPFLMKKYGLNIEESAGIIAMIFIGGAVGCPFVAWVAERLRARKVVMFCGTFIILFLSIYLLYVPIYSNLKLYVILFFTGFCCSIYVIPFTIVKETIQHHACGTAMAFTNVLCGAIGSIVFQPLSGYILSVNSINNVETLEGYYYALSIIPISMIIALFLIFFMKVNKMKKEELKSIK